MIPDYAEAYNEAIEALMQEQEKSERLSVENSLMRAAMKEAEGTPCYCNYSPFDQTPKCPHVIIGVALESLKTPQGASAETVVKGEP